MNEILYPENRLGCCCVFVLATLSVLVGIAIMYGLGQIF